MKSLSLFLLILVLSVGLVAGCSEKKEPPKKALQLQEAPAPEKKPAPAEGGAPVQAQAPSPETKAEAKAEGAVEQQASPKTAAGAPAAAEKAAGPARAAQPEKARIDPAPLFRAMCAACHGAQAQGSAIAPAFKGNNWVRDANLEEVAATIRKGRSGPAKRYRNFPLPMPPQKGLSDAEVDALAGYVKGIASR